MHSVLTVTNIGFRDGIVFFFCLAMCFFVCFFFVQVAEGVDTALALADLITKVDKSYRIDLKYAIIFGGEDF